MPDFKKIAEDIGTLVQQKNLAYGDSFARSGEILRVLFPNGVQPDQYQDLLAVARIIDKLFRIATDRDALGESPFRDIAGYALLGIANHQTAQTNKKALHEALTAMRCGEPIPDPLGDLYRETLAGIRATPSSKESHVREYAGHRVLRGDDDYVGIVVVKKDRQDDGWYTSNVGQGYDADLYGEALLFDQKLVRAVLDNNANAFHQVVADRYGMAAAPPFARLEVQWVKPNHAFRVIRIDGGEQVVDAAGTEDSSYPAIMAVDQT